MKETFIGCIKELFYIIFLLFVFWAFKGFEHLSQFDVAIVLSVGAIVNGFVDKEGRKRNNQ